MLFPMGGIPVQEFDLSCTISPTFRQAHHSDTAMVSTEMLVVNNTAEAIKFPFLVLSTDPGTGAANKASVEPRVVNGSQDVAVDEIDEQEAARLAHDRVTASGGDADIAANASAWVERALAAAERIRIGRTTIKPGESRRIISQQRLRIQPDATGVFRFVTIAPSPVFTVLTRGRVSAYVLLPFEDEDVRVTVLPDRTEQNYGYELTRIKQRQITSWYWQNDPVLKLAYQYN